MALPDIDPRLGRPLRTYFSRRGPWAAHFARSGNIPKQPCTGSNTPMGPWPGELGHGLLGRWAIGLLGYSASTLSGHRAVRLLGCQVIRLLGY